MADDKYKESLARGSNRAEELAAEFLRGGSSGRSKDLNDFKSKLEAEFHRKYPGPGLSTNLGGSPYRSHLNTIPTKLTEIVGHERRYTKGLGDNYYHNLKQSSSSILDHLNHMRDNSLDKE